MNDAAPTSEPAWRRRLPFAALAIGLVVIGLIVWLVWARGDREKPSFTGYVVTDDLYLSSPVAGSVAALWVVRGERVAAGARLFLIDPVSLTARADQARAQIGEAEASADAERAALAKAQAGFAAAEAEAGRADADLARYLASERAKPGSVARLQIDQASAAAVTARRQRDAARDDVVAAQARIASAGRSIDRSRAGLTDARRQVEQLSPRTPVAGRIEDILYQRGEWAPANAPVIDFIPDGQVKVRFYVPQGVVAGYRPGTPVAIACDGCAAGMTAAVDRVASRPEYTPPVIYSLKTRDKLVFMVEAVPARPELLSPGQPIDVGPASRER
jgi:HlyD family secretion protein